MIKPLATICLLIATSPGGALAQSPPAGAPPDPQVRLAALSRELALTDTQKPLFAQILAQERSALLASMQQERENGTDIRTAHQNHQKIEDAALAKLQPVLSDEQYRKYQGIVAAEAYARHHRPADSSAPAAAPGG